MQLREAERASLEEAHEVRVGHFAAVVAEMDGQTQRRARDNRGGS